SKPKKNQAETPAPTPQKPKTHHNSPQNQKINLIHSQVVRPPLLTFRTPRKGTWLQKRAAREAGAQPDQSYQDRQKKKAPSSKGWGLRICRRSPNLPHTYACSTIGPARLNFRVRDGNGCDPRGKLTGKLLKSRSRDLPQLNRLE